MLVEKEKEAEREKKAPLASETEVEDKDDEAHGFIFRGEEISDRIPSHLSLQRIKSFSKVSLWMKSHQGQPNPVLPPSLLLLFPV